MAADFFLGESLVGDGNEVAHIDLIIGSKSGPAGSAFCNALANNKDGFTTLLAVVAPNPRPSPTPCSSTRSRSRAPSRRSRCSDPRRQRWLAPWSIRLPAACSQGQGGRHVRSGGRVHPLGRERR